MFFRKYKEEPSKNETLIVSDPTIRYSPHSLQFYTKCFMLMEGAKSTILEMLLMKEADFIEFFMDIKLSHKEKQAARTFIYGFQLLNNEERELFI